jgi:predicted enzyme related to lactoylglutathione lyase
MDHTICHFEISAEDIESLKKFYSQLFGWKIDKMEGMDYWNVQTVPADEKGYPKGPGVNGGMLKKRDPEHKFIYYVLVESIDEYGKKIEELGGRIIVEKTEVPNIGWWAIASDPESNYFGIFEEK